MSDLTNQINELFDGPQQPEQEPVVEQVVEEVQPPKKKHVYKKLEKPSFKREQKETQVIVERKRPVPTTNFNINESIDSLFAAADREEVQEMKNALVPKRGPTPEQIREQKISARHKRNMERAGAAISMLESKKKEQKPVIIREDKTTEERLAILEQDFFDKMSNATPNTLVSGIGASLDSGGGAVWLWDLEDVDIGAPLNGQYPAIANGSILKYNGAKSQWDIGTPGTASGVTTDDVFLVNPVTLLAYQSSLQTLPAPDGDVTTQTDANQWFQKAILYLDEQIGGEDGDLETQGNLDFVSTDQTEGLRRYNNADASLNIEIGADENNLTTTTIFKETQTTLNAQTVVIRDVSSLGDDDELFSVRAATGSAYAESLKITKSEFKVGAIDVKFNNLDSPTNLLGEGPGYLAPSNTWNIQGKMPTSDSDPTTVTGPVLYRINMTDDYSPENTDKTAIRYQGMQAHEDDIATVGYVSTHGGASGDYLPTTGGTMTGQLNMKNDISFQGSGRRIKFKDNTYNSLLFTCDDGTDFFGLDSQDGAGDEDHSMFYYVPQNHFSDITFSGTNQTISVPDGSSTALTFQVSDDANTEYFHLDSNANEIETTSNMRIKGERIYVDGAGGTVQMRLSDNRQEALLIRNQDGGGAEMLRFCTSNSGVKLDTDVEFNSNMQLNVKTKRVDFITSDYNSFRVEGSIGNTESDGTTPVKTDVLLKTFIRDRDSIQPDYIEYFGSTSGNNSIQTKASVQSLINASGAGEGVVFTFKGAIDATDNNAYPSSPVVGDYYMNDTAGTAGTSFVGIAGTTLATNQLIVFTANEDTSGNPAPWVTGASAAPADVYVPLAGNVDVTGPLTFTDPTGAFITGPTGSNIALNASGVVSALQFSSSGNSSVGGNLTVTGESTLTDDVTCQGDVVITGDISAGAGGFSSLAVSNNSLLGGTLEMAGSADNKLIYFTGSGDPKARFNFKATGDDDFAERMVVSKDGVQANFAFSVASNAGTKVVVIDPETTTDGNNDPVYPVATFGKVDGGINTRAYGNLQLKAASAGVTDGKFIIKDISDNTNYAIYSGGSVETKGNYTFNDTVNAVQNIRAYGKSGKEIQIKLSDDVTSPTYVTAAKFASTKVVFPRIKDNGTEWTIEGTTSDDTSTVTGNLFSVFRNPKDGANSDAVNYYGRVAGDANIQTKASVEALIANSHSVGDTNLTQGGVIEKDGGSVNNTGVLELVQSADGVDDGKLQIKDFNGNPQTALFATGEIRMGADLRMGNANNASTVKTIKILGEDNATATVDFSLSTDGAGTSYTDIFQISPTQVTSGKSFAVTNSIGGSTMFLVDGSNGNMSMGTNLIIGSHSTGTNCQINAVGTTNSNATLQINSYQTVSGTSTHIAKFSVDDVQFAKTLNIGATLGAGTTQLNTGGRVDLSGANSGNLAWSTTLNNQIIHNSTTGTFYLSKVNGTNSSAQPYNAIFFNVGKSDSTNNTGAKSLLKVINSNGTHMVTLESSVRQTDAIDVATVGTVDTKIADALAGQDIDLSSPDLLGDVTIIKGGTGNVDAKLELIGGDTNPKFTVEQTGKITNSGQRASETAGTVNLTSDGNTLHFDNIATNYAQFAKTGGTNSSSEPNNHMQFFCGSTDTSSNVGVRYPVLTISNMNGTYAASIANTNAVNSIRQSVATDLIIKNTLDTEVATINTALNGKASLTGDNTISGVQTFQSSDSTQILKLEKDKLTLGGGTNQTKLIFGSSNQYQDIELAANQVLTMKFGSEKPLYIQNYASGLGTRILNVQSIEFDNIINPDQNAGGYIPNGTTRIQYLSDPTLWHEASNKQYVDNAVAGISGVSLSGSNTWTGYNTFQAGAQLSKIENITAGALSFHWNATNATSPKAYILIQGAGSDTSGSDPGELIVARDTATGNVSANDTFMTYYAGRGGNPVKTVFSNTVEVPTPVNSNDAVTKAYADQHLISTTETYNEGTFTITMEAVNTGSGVTPQNPSTLKTTTGYYVRIGNQVTISFEFGATSTAGYFGQAKFSGLPFAGKTGIGDQMLEIWSFNMLNNQDGNAAERDDFHFAIQAGHTYAYIYNTQSSKTTTANINQNQNSALMTVTGSYITQD